MRLQLLIFIALIFSVEHSFSTSSIKRWPKTGDHYIDKSIEKLNELERSNEIPNQSLTKEALRPLFTRAAFKYHLISEESWDDFLYALVRTTEILEYYKSNFNADERKILNESLKAFNELKSKVSDLYGESFDIDLFRRKYYKQNKFLSKLPSYIGRITESELTEPRNQLIKKAMGGLKEIGLID